VVGSNVLVSRQTAHRGCLHRDPHVDEVLGQGDALRVPGDGDGPVQVGGGVAVLAVGDADHRARQLPDLCHLGASLADDAADELVGDGHLVGLLGARAPGLARTSQQGQGGGVDDAVGQGVDSAHHVHGQANLRQLLLLRLGDGLGGQDGRGGGEDGGEGEVVDAAHPHAVQPRHRHRLQGRVRHRHALRRGL